MPISKLDRRGEDLREACHSGDADKVHALISQGVDVNDANKMNSWTPLHWAVHRNRTQVVRVLLENGADLTAQTDKGKTATDMADGKPEILTLLGVDAETAASSVAKEVDASGVGRVPNYIRNPTFFYSDDANKDRQNRVKETAEFLPRETMQTASGSAAAAAIIGGAQGSYADSNTNVQGNNGDGGGGGGGADFAAMAVGMMRENAALREALDAAKQVAAAATEAAMMAVTEQAETFDVRVHMGSKTHTIIGVHKDSTLAQLFAVVPVPAMLKAADYTGPPLRLFANQEQGLLMMHQTCGMLRTHMLPSDAAPEAVLELYMGLDQ